MVKISNAGFVPIAPQLSKFYFRKFDATFAEALKIIQRLTRVIKIMMSDDEYDFMAGKIPAYMMKLKHRKNEIYKHLWSK